jgi:hypothetical protein
MLYTACMVRTAFVAAPVIADEGHGGVTASVRFHVLGEGLLFIAPVIAGFAAHQKNCPIIARRP